MKSSFIFKYTSGKMILLLLLTGLVFSCSPAFSPRKDDNSKKIAAVAIAILPPTSSGYSIGGTITGLTADSLVLQNNSADDLTVAANSTKFTFSAKGSGAVVAYSVTVKTQPTGLTCTVSSGSGNATADVSNVSIACSGSSVASCGTSVTRDWGTFCDMNNGTVKLVVNGGTFGGNTYTAQTLYFAKCSHGQTYDSSGNTCMGTATTVNYCNTADNSCNGGTNAGTLNGSGTSGAYSACSGLSLASKSWRVPTKSELKLLINCTTATEMPNDGGTCSSYTSPTVNDLFPNTQLSNYWSSSGNLTFATKAWVVSFNSGQTYNVPKTDSNYVRCAAD